MASTTRRFGIATLACTALLVTACGGSSTLGRGTLAASLLPTGSSAQSSGPTAFPSAPPASGQATTAGGSCPSGAFCDDFSDTGSGWTDENKAHFYAGYNDYLGGTYRVGERTDATVSETAPVKVSDIAADYSVQVDVDAVLGNSMPATTSFGISCWEHTAKDGESTSAFVFLVSASQVSIGLWGDSDGTYHEITSKSASLLESDGSANHLTALCVQGSSGGSAQAQLSIAVNGTTAASATYDKSVHNYEWAVGQQIGLLASGTGSDVFYDNFAVSSKCRGDFC